METVRKVVLAVGLLVLLAVVAGPVALAFAHTAPTAAAGEWTWVNESFREELHHNGGAFLKGDEAGTWAGTFEGVSHDSFLGSVSASGDLRGTVWVEFESVSVNGASGGLKMRFSWYVNESYAFGGRWTILSGSGDLRHLRGSGEWIWADDVGVEGGARYSGMIWEQ